MKLSLIFFIALILLGQTSFGQKKVCVTVKLPSGIDYTKMILSFNNGQYNKGLKPIITNNSLTISENYYSRYATITFNYPDSTETDGIPGFAFLVSGDSATISFYQDNIKNKNPFRNYRLVNASTFAEMGESQYLKFISLESADALNFYLKNKDSIRSSEKYRNILDRKCEKSERKELEFIALNANQYYSLWLYKTEIAEGS